MTIPGAKMSNDWAKWVMVGMSALKKRILQFHSCWWPGNARSQGISCHDVDLFLPEYFGLCCCTVIFIYLIMLATCIYRWLNMYWGWEKMAATLADDIFKCIILDESVRISIKILLKFVPKGPIKNIPALVQIMAWRRPGDKPLSEPITA